MDGILGLALSHSLVGAVIGSVAYPLRMWIGKPPVGSGLMSWEAGIIWLILPAVAFANAMLIVYFEPPRETVVFSLLWAPVYYAMFAHGFLVMVLNAIGPWDKNRVFRDTAIGFGIVMFLTVLLAGPWFFLLHGVSCTYGSCL